jgi:glucose dehydrogenase
MRVFSNSWSRALLLIVLALLVVGSLAVFSLRANGVRISSIATATALAKIDITATAAALAYDADTSKGIMFGFDPAHSRWNQSERVLNASNILDLKLDWMYATGGGIRSSPTIANGLVYVGSRDDKLYAFDATCRSNCKPLWTYATGDSIDFTSPTVANGVVYVGSVDHNLYAFDATCRGSCKPLWRYATGAPIYTSPTVANGVVYVGSDDNNVYAFGIAV